VLVRDAHRQLRWLAIPAASTNLVCDFNDLEVKESRCTPVALHIRLNTRLLAAQQPWGSAKTGTGDGRIFSPRSHRCSRVVGNLFAPVPSENTICRGSSSSTLVPMVQSPDLGERDDLSGVSVVDRPWIGRILLER
jgi:hypothetical protein